MARVTSEPMGDRAVTSSAASDNSELVSASGFTCICPGCPAPAKEGWLCWPCWSAKVDGRPHQPCQFCGAHIGNVTAYTKGRHELYCSKNPDGAEFVPDTGEDEARDRRHMAGSGWRESKV